MLRWLFLDMNSYFASVEQQLQPQLRGRPVAVAPVHTDSTSCIAASYEAKRFGVKTGTNVGMARHMCPGLMVVPARPREYVAFHKRIIDVVEGHLHVESVMSIDEMACRLPSNFCEPDTARGIALSIKASLARDVGEYVTCSIGLAPNRFLAKVASDMHKPDGLVMLRAEDLPGRLMGLHIRDLPGVGPQMQLRLAAFGADTVAALWAMTPEQLVHAWGGRVGRHFWRNLHGEGVTELPTHRGSISHSNVLAPELRTDAGAFAVLMRLVHKGAARMRDMGYAARHLTLEIRYENKTKWDAGVGLDAAQDNQTFMEALEGLWVKRPPGTPRKVGIVLAHLEHAAAVSGSLFRDDTRRVDLARAMDRVNAKHGRQMLYFAEMHGTRHAAPLRIAFNSVPEEEW